MNPILPRNHFVPDGEARVMPDGRLYLYGSYDISGKNSYCSDVLHVFSTDDMVNWTDHGVCFRSSDVPWAEEGSELYAPDCIYRDGRYYLYFCMNGNVEGVAQSQHPWGPFQDPRPIAGADGDSIDPAVFVDDDGQAYYYWGQFRLRGARMSEDMCTLDLAGLKTGLIDEKRHGFHEGASLRKRNNLYYLVYTDITRGRATCLGYAVSRSPLGPFERRGIIVDNIGCDPGSWNNHGSITQYGGQWYVFYHRSSQNGEHNRRMCAEPIFFDEEGNIREVLPTTQGCQPPIPACSRIAAADACRLGGWGSRAYIAPDPLAFGEEVLTGASGNGWAVYRYVHFSGSIAGAALELEADGPGRIEVWAGEEKLGEIPVDDTIGERKIFSGVVNSISGVHPLYLEWRMEQGCAAVLKAVEFSQAV